MTDAILSFLRDVSQTAPFNRLAGFEVDAAEEGKVVLSMPWNEDFAQYSGFLHAALIGGLIDTACGFAAATYSRNGVLASHFSVTCLAPAVGDRFLCRGEVIKAGPRQIFTRAELFALRDSKEKLVATGEAILVPVDAAGRP